MTRLAAVRKSYRLFAIGALEIGMPFVRMMLLSRALDLRELGFASALASAYAMFEQITDIAIYRFVYSMPREDYLEALGGAQALSVLRGLSVGLLASALSPLIAAAFSLQTDWSDFAILGAIIFIRSFEHLEPKVAERDYNFGPQLKTSLVSNALCLLALVAALAIWRDHKALTASLIGQMIGLVVASHLVSKTPYRLNFHSLHFSRAFHFGYPLMFNGLGLALSAQGDRFLVGSLLGLPALGVYSVVMLAVIVPITMVYRIMGSLTSAALYNAGKAEDGLRQRLRLAARLSPMVAALYAVGVLLLANIVVPLVFGAQFRISTLGLSLLAVGAFLRIARGEPFGSLLLLAQRTKRLAVSSLSVMIALLFAFGLMLYDRRVEAALTGRALGELLSLGVTLYLTRNVMRGAASDYGLSFLLGVLSVAFAIAAIFLTPAGEKWLPSLFALGVYAILFVAWGLTALRPLLPRGGKPALADELPVRESLQG